MTAQLITFPGADWRKSTTTIAATGRVIEAWEIKRDRRAMIIREDDGYYWRVWRPIQHRKPQPRQRYRPITEWALEITLSVAMAAAAQSIAA